MFNTDDELDEDPHEVLDMFYKKNKPIKPPASSSRVSGNVLLSQLIALMPQLIVLSS
jgi:hypothetical protein